MSPVGLRNDRPGRLRWAAGSDDVPFPGVERFFAGGSSDGGPFGSLAAVGSTERESGAPVSRGNGFSGLRSGTTAGGASFLPFCPRAAGAADVANSIIPRINNSRRPMDSIPSLGAAPIDATPRK